MQKKSSYQNPDSNNNSIVASATGHNSRLGEQRALAVPKSPKNFGEHKALPVTKSPKNFTMDKKSSMMSKPP